MGCTPLSGRAKPARASAWACAPGPPGRGLPPAPSPPPQRPNRHSCGLACGAYGPRLARPLGPARSQTPWLVAGPIGGHAPPQPARALAPPRQRYMPRPPSAPRAGPATGAARLGRPGLSTHTGQGLCCGPPGSHAGRPPPGRGTSVTPPHGRLQAPPQSASALGFAVRHAPPPPRAPQGQTFLKRHGRLRAVTRVAIPEAQPQRYAPIAPHPETAPHLLAVGTALLARAICRTRPPSSVGLLSRLRTGSLPSFLVQFHETYCLRCS